MREHVRQPEIQDQRLDPGAFAPRPGRGMRVVREPPLTGAELAALLVTLVMVCGPLALGAFGL